VTDNRYVVSVVLPVYNAEKYIGYAIDSILNQTFTEYEFIIVNDGSTDSTEKIILEYSNKDSRIRVITRENKGLVTSLNEGIAEARAGLIARMDADDIALPERLEEQVKFMNDNPEVVCVGTAPIVIDEDGDELIALGVPSQNSVIQERLLSGHCPIEHPSVMYRTECVRALGGYRREFETAEDYDLWLRMGEVGLLANINKPLLKYRYLNTSISAKNQLKQSEVTRLSCEQAWERRGVKSEYTATSEWRMGESRKSRFEFSLKFGWWAFSYKNKYAALKYARRAIMVLPANYRGWKLLFFSLIKL
jgi:glycosyltransferase involved in cell wall biosynthesis